MIVYRMAHSEVIDKRVNMPCGPYAGSWYAIEWSESDPKKLEQFMAAREKLVARSCTSAHLTPFADYLLNNIQPHEICGFSDEKSLRRWFKGCLMALKAVGFEEQQYEVPDSDVRLGLNGQVVFAALNAKRVRGTK
jgi:hypothetical protein